MQPSNDVLIGSGKVGIITAFPSGDVLLIFRILREFRESATGCNVD